MKKSFFLAVLLATLGNLFVAQSQSLYVYVPWVEICQGDTTMLVAQPYGGVPPYTFQWNTGDTNDSIVISPAVTTTYTVTVWDSQPLSFVNTGEVIVDTFPAQPSNILGNYCPSPGYTEIYSVNMADTNTDYTWTLPADWTLTQGQGTNIVHALVGSISGNIEVLASNACGISPIQSLLVTPACGLTLIPKAGVVYNDQNQNGVRDIGEPPFHGMIVLQNPVPYYVATNDSGEYSAFYDTGTYTLVLPNFDPYCTVTPASHSLTGLNDTTNDFGVYCTPVTDVEVTIDGSGLRPGLTGAWCHVHCYNNGNTIVNGSVHLKYDSLLIYTGATLPFAYHGNDSIVWDYTSLQPDQLLTFSVFFNVPSNAVLGDTVYYDATVLPIIGDTARDNNIYHLYKIVVASCDPNYKLVSEQSLTEVEVSDEPDLYYTIHFQNTGTDTAHLVIIKDTLSSDLIIPSIETIAAGHPYVFSMEPNGSAVWTFDNIMLPDSGADQGGSNAYIMFRVKAKSNLIMGDTIKNNAAIYFDLNAPVITNFATTIIKGQAITVGELNRTEGILQVFPNPANDKLNIIFTSPGTATLQLNIFSISGQRVYSESIKNQIGNYAGTVDLKLFPEGVYFVQIVSEKVTEQKRVVVIK